MDRSAVVNVHWPQLKEAQNHAWFLPDILSKSREQLISDIQAGKIHDTSGQLLDPEGTILCFTQLHHLDAQEQGDRMLRYARCMLWLTVAVTIFTVANVALVAFTLVGSGAH